MECNHEEKLEQQAIIIDNQEQIMVAMYSMQSILIDTIVPLVDRMTDEEKQKWVQAASHLQMLNLQIKSLADQARAARIAYGIEAE
jgi:hypothetical protein